MTRMRRLTLPLKRVPVSSYAGQPTDHRTARCNRAYQMGETELKALDSVSLQVNPGDYLCIMGLLAEENPLC